MLFRISKSPAEMVLGCYAGRGPQLAERCDHEGEVFPTKHSLCVWESETDLGEKWKKQEVH